MTASNYKKSKWARFERALEIAAEAGSIAMSLRDRPRRLDWIGLGLRAVSMAVRIGADRERALAGEPWQYFEDEGLDCTWIEVPEEFRRLIIDLVGRSEVVESHWDGELSSDRPVIGKIGGEQIGWIQESNGHVCDGPYVLADRANETYAAIGTRLWRRLGTRSCIYGTGGLVADEAPNVELVETAQLRGLRERVARFLEHDLPRSYLLAGPPGTGKSMCIRKCVADLDLTSLRVDLVVLSNHHGYKDKVVAGLETLIKVLKPEVVILDDIDRVSGSGKLLHFLELVVRSARVVFASANHTDAMMGASLRPGRFDEVIVVDRLDRKVLSTLVGPEDTDLLDRLEAMPVAYVSEFIKRRRVLGREQAVRELEELAARLEKVNKATGSGN